MRPLLASSALAFLAAGSLSGGQPETTTPSRGWSLTVEPYLWAIGMAGEVGVKGLPSTHVSHNPVDVLQHLDWGIMAKAELRNQKWGLLADGLFAQLSAEGNPPAPLYSNADLTIQQGMASLSLSFRVIDDRRGFLDVYAGARYNYFGFEITGIKDSSGIDELSHGVAERVSAGLARKAGEFLAQNAGALGAVVETALTERVTEKALEQIAALTGDVLNSISPADRLRLLNAIRKNSGAYRELVAATAQARVASSKGSLSAALKNRLRRAEKAFAKELARRIGETLPSSAEGSQWWVDPVVGLRGQINLTRSVFLAAQADVGGFGAGSRIAWNAQASVGVNFTKSIFGEIGLRFFYMDYDRGGFLYQAAEYGLFSGVGVRF